MKTLISGEAPNDEIGAPKRLALFQHMSADRTDHTETAEHERLRVAVQLAQERYEAALRLEMADVGESEAALEKLSAANQAYDAYLQSFPGKMGS